jgi:hypothetical protein
MTRTALNPTALMPKKRIQQLTMEIQAKRMLPTTPRFSLSKQGLQAEIPGKE